MIFHKNRERGYILYLFTRQGLQEYKNNREALARKVQRLQKELQQQTDRRAKSGNSDEGGDFCPEHDDATRDIANTNKLIEKMDGAIANRSIVQPPLDNVHLAIGHIATIQRYDDHGHTIGAPERYLIGGYNSTDLKASLLVLSYDAPIIERLIGKRADPRYDPTELYIGGKTIYVELVKIDSAFSAAQLKAVS